MRFGTMPAPWISPVARSSRRTYGASLRGKSSNRRTSRLSPTPPASQPLLRWKHRSIAANRVSGRTRNISPTWLWNGTGWGARLVLADQVFLGKTVQLAVAALLMALDDPDGGPILVLAPKPLLQQWQDELMELLLLPSARWNGRAWVDENDLEYPSEGAKSLGKCPRRIGLVSQGLVVRGLSEAINLRPDS